MNTPTSEPGTPETKDEFEGMDPAEAAIRREAQKIGRKVRDDLHRALSSMEIHIGSWIFAPMHKGQIAESEHLVRHGLKTKEDHEALLDSIQKSASQGAPHGVTIMM